MKSVAGFRYFSDGADTLAFLKGLPKDQQGFASEVKKALAFPQTALTPRQNEVIDSFDRAHHQEFLDFMGSRSLLKTADSILLPLPATKGSADGRTYRPSDKNKLVKKIDGLLKK